MTQIWSIFCLFILIFRRSQSQPFLQHKDPAVHRFSSASPNDEYFFKKLEYEANQKGDGSAFGLTEIDFNHIRDDVLAEEIADGVEQQLEAIDKQNIGEPPLKNNAAANAPQKKPSMSLMHQGVFEPMPKFNALVDGLILNAKRDFRRRKMDTIYFTVHKRGIVRHTPKGHKTHQGELVRENGAPATEDASQNRTGVLGGGHISGLLKLRRFGNAESRKEGSLFLVRSHYFFGPLKVELVFRATEGLKEINSTLRSLAAHALYKVDEMNNKTTLIEFLVDSPMEYEVELRGSRNKRLRALSQSALLRLFKRDGRMAARIQRSFDRATKRKIKDVTKEKEDNSMKKKNNFKNAQKFGKLLKTFADGIPAKRK